MTDLQKTFISGMTNKNDFSAYQMFCTIVNQSADVREFAEFTGNQELMDEFMNQRTSSGCGSCGGGKVR